MAFATKYSQANGIGTVSEEAASLEIVPKQNGELYPYIEKITFSVWKAAVSGAGICQIKTVEGGDVIWTIDVSTVKDEVVDWGPEGVKVSDVKGDGLQAVVSGGGTQASVSIGITAHYDKE